MQRCDQISMPYHCVAMYSCFLTLIVNAHVSLLLTKILQTANRIPVVVFVVHVWKVCPYRSAMVTDSRNRFHDSTTIQRKCSESHRRSQSDLLARNTPTHTENTRKHIVIEPISSTYDMKKRKHATAHRRAWSLELLTATSLGT